MRSILVETYAFPGSTSRNPEMQEIHGIGKEAEKGSSLHGTHDGDHSARHAAIDKDGEESPRADKGAHGGEELHVAGSESTEGKEGKPRHQGETGPEKSLTRQPSLFQRPQRKPNQQARKRDSVRNSPGLEVSGDRHGEEAYQCQKLKEWNGAGHTVS